MALLPLCSAPFIGNHDSSDLSGTIYSGESVTLTQGTRYLLYSQLFVDDGGLLVIEPGVTVFARRLEFSVLEEQSPVIIVRRGGRIIANGTAELPITFTAEPCSRATPSPCLNDPLRLDFSTELVCIDPNTGRRAEAG